MQFRLKIVAALAAVSAVIAFAPSAATAGAGPSGPGYAYEVVGQIGAIAVNPYKIAPLTAVIYNGGYVLRNVSVRIVPKENGQEIRYEVGDRQAMTYGGIPVFGLYPDYLNTVEVEYDRIRGAETKHVKES